MPETASPETSPQASARPSAAQPTALSDALLRELELRRLLDALRSQHREAREVDAVVRATLRTAADFVGAEGAAVMHLDHEGGAQAIFETGPCDWNTDLVAAFLRNERPPLQPDFALAPVQRKMRPRWRVLVLHREQRPFSSYDRSALSAVARELSVQIERMDRHRTAAVRARIDRKIMEELRPKDLFYQILHGLRTLTRYDHSAALLIAGESHETLTLVAEQIAWRKGKSGRIGRRLVLGREVRQLLESGRLFGFTRGANDRSHWTTWAGGDAALLAELLDSDEGERDGSDVGAPDVVHEEVMIVAPLVTPDGVVGALRVASRRPEALGSYELELVGGFLPQVSVAIQNSRRTETLEAKMLEAERENAMANLARSVAHDVNNALGSVVPLVQQLRRELDDGEVDPRDLTEDLESIEKSLQVCRRIFGGMLSFARNAAKGGGEADVRRALDSALTILRPGIDRRRIDLDLQVPDDLPCIPCSQGDLEQLLFNLLSNACDAMPGGGTLAVAIEVVPGGKSSLLAVTIKDTGSGIPDDKLTQVREPFFTTKAAGHGLGLTICRSILWEMRGRMEISSREGKGTRVDLFIPTAPRSEAPLRRDGS